MLETDPLIEEHDDWTLPTRSDGWFRERKTDRDEPPSKILIIQYSETTIAIKILSIERRNMHIMH